MPFIKKITSQQTFAVRQPVLRPGKSLDTCVFEGDDLATTVHFGVFEDENLLGVISVFKAGHDFFTEANQCQIRGMAVLERQQKKGLGELLVRAAEEYVSQQNGKKIWFNAREIAIGFYKKMGYAVIGEPFTIGDIGIHYVMHKTL